MFLHEGDIISLKMLDGNDTKLYPFQVESREAPNNYTEFSLGSATALAQAGTGWNTIQDSSNRYILEPEYTGVIYQVFYGISPSYARVYRQYPSGVDRGSLTGTRNPGADPIGYVSGDQSPLLQPSPTTELFTVRGQHPAYYGYHPYARPATANIKMTFYIVSYAVNGVRTDDQQWIMNNSERIVSMGGRTLMAAPGWVREDTHLAVHSGGVL